jgi:hypothetical protein
MVPDLSAMTDLTVSGMVTCRPALSVMIRPSAACRGDPQENRTTDNNGIKIISRQWKQAPSDLRQRMQAPSGLSQWMKVVSISLKGFELVMHGG